MTISGWTVALIVAIVFVVVLAAGWAFQTANRLDRLNVRVDLARQALDAALARRAVVARSIAAGMIAGYDDQVRAVGQDLAAAADQAEHAVPDSREQAENAVSTLLAQLDTGSRPQGLVVELADAETRIMMARRFYNDAVRDTRNLAERRLVVWLHLGGTAELPQFFEIVERVTPASGS
ncbi:LemA family protein [Gordonia sp. Z-3]|uniref:LemA family protein n=2 Tax=Gordonia TaxID=2053 RepID=A0A9X3I5Y7_9ACTN|nr:MULTISPECIES: LemA family protein [Gordonia]MCF3937500.1 LemA family protein [Gordonia tangerina]MCX2965520.1 LemA family protein [Gordonia aquimaris]MED5800269.1 LemA family protein [Gordonia sp. Z-3]